MDTHFAPAARADEEIVSRGVGLVTSHPLMSGLLEMEDAVLAILNEQRQILALNDIFLRQLGISDPTQVLGMRVGEALQCVHANEMPGGCGTSKYCSTCGAAIAMVAALELGHATERRCVLTAEHEGHRYERCLSVRARAVPHAEATFIVVFIRDITVEEERAALERVFYHDIANIAAGVQGLGESLADAPPRMRERMQEQLVKLCERLGSEISVQRVLSRATAAGYQAGREHVVLEDVCADLCDIAGQHPAAYGRHIKVREPLPVGTVATDRTLLQRVLLNMVTNALEHTPRDGCVDVWVEAEDKTCTFCVQNDEVIPPEIVRRVFQRYFTTKSGEGHGLGTYAMKLLGEQVLGGEVEFTSDVQAGTVFRLRLPRC